jgi:uncharacterized membrane protein (DUF2068 family)
MALLYLSNLILNKSSIKFTQAETNVEKALSSYTKFKYEQVLLGSEIGIYNALFFHFKNGLPKNKNLTKYYILYGNILVLPFTLYRTFQYINSKNIKFIDFNQD